MTDAQGKTVWSKKRAILADFMQEIVTLPGPALWYPRGYGEQPLYTFRCETEGASVSQRFGIGVNSIDVDAATERTTGFRILEYCITMVLTISGVYAGIRYAVASGRKKMMDMNVGLPLAFGAAFLIASLMEGDTITYPFQYIMISLSVNQMGFDPAAASMIEGGLTEEQAVEALLQLANADWFAYLCESLSIICSAVVNTCAAVIFFGVYEEKLQKSWLAYAFGGYLVFWIPGLINLIVTLPTVVILVVMLVLTAAVLYFTKKALTSEMPEAWAAMISKPQSARPNKKTAEPPKMPKIKMPD